MHHTARLHNTGTHIAMKERDCFWRLVVSHVLENSGWFSPGFCLCVICASGAGGIYPVHQMSLFIPQKVLKLKGLL